MSDYLRREKLSFKYMPIFWLLRILFCLAVIFSGYAQWCVMIIGTFASIGFIYSTEMENMLPMTDEEIKAVRFMRVRNVWLRYLFLGLISILVHFLLLDRMGDTWFPTPIIIMHFVLQMINMYDTFLDAITPKALKGDFRSLVKKTEISKYFTETIPRLVFFIYGISLIITHGIINEGSVWVHVVVLGIASILMGLNVVRDAKAWRLMDYDY